MTQRAFAVGDVHAYHTDLIRLMRKLWREANFNPLHDRLIFLGDCVDGGPYASAVLSYLRDIQCHQNVICLMGNHEQMMLDALAPHATHNQVFGWWHQGGFETAQSFMPGGEEASPFNLDRVRQCMGSHLDWVVHLPDIYQWGDYVFVHAGLDPIDKMSTCHLDRLWIRDEFIDYQDEIIPGKTIVFGHTWQPEPLAQKYKIGIDTMHHHGGYLTAVELHESRDIEPRFWTSQ